MSVRVVGPCRRVTSPIVITKFAWLCSREQWRTRRLHQYGFSSLACFPHHLKSQQSKTKAKKRYLKKKKERRKTRKAAQPKSTKVVVRNDESSGSEPESSDEDEEEVKTPQTKVSKKTEAKEPPRKRRRLSIEEEERVETQVKASAEDEDEDDEDDLMEGAEDAEDEDEHMDVEDRAVTPDVPRRSPTPPAALPSFPIPAQPDAPSKADLALQGLDKALVNAELVDSTQVLSLPADENDGGTNLSLRTRKRLHELGITELFAGSLFLPHICALYLMDYSPNRPPPFPSLQSLARRVYPI